MKSRCFLRPDDARSDAVIRMDCIRLWRDFDDAWERIESVGLRVLGAQRYDAQNDARTGVPRVVLEPADFT